MKELKKQIRESFFNPILYFLPVMIYLVVDEFVSQNAAWKISFPVALLLLFYVYFLYNRLFLWFVFVSIGYLLVGVVSSIFPENTNQFLLVYSDELMFIAMLALLLTIKDKIEKVSSKTLPHQIPMSNNVNELYRVANVLLSITAIFIIVNILIYYSSLLDDTYLQTTKALYAVSLTLIAIYETIRVMSVRKKLEEEDWLPIVSKRGKVLGSSQFQLGVPMDKNLMYPVVRFYFVERGMLLLRKRLHNENTDPNLWDASASKHVRITESIEQALKNLAHKQYGIVDDNFFYLTNYEYEGTFNRQLIYLFLYCNSKDFKKSETSFDTIKWWTSSQITDNLGKGIFAERFEKEYLMLQRSGLLEPDAGCECECVLRDTVAGN